MRTRTVVAVAVAVVVVAGLGVPALLMYHRLHPDRVNVDDDPGRHGMSYEQVAFGSALDGAPLSGWYLPAPRPTGRAIVIVPGIDNNRLMSGVTLRLAPSLLAAGFDVLAFDLRGEGESGGEPITFGLREQWDVLGAVHEAQARGARQVGVLGFSLGAASTILAAARSADVAAVVADSAFADLRDTLTRELEQSDHLPGPAVAYVLTLYALMSGTDPGDVSPVQAIARIAPRPVLLIQGGVDRTVPPVDSERLLSAADRRSTVRWLVPSGGHAASYFTDPVGYANRVVAFFTAAMPAA
jgi:fermentation-respiration switch protein FrsA (DUF1100 family)